MKYEAIEVKGREPKGDLLQPSDLYVQVVRTYREKCRNSNVSILFAGIMGGALIGIAGLFYVTVMTDNGLTGGAAKLVGGLSFSLGLVMISITGAELFTGNILASLPKAYGMISMSQMTRSWSAIYISNFIGALAIGLAAAASGMLVGPIEGVLQGVVDSKLAHSVQQNFFEGILANFLVCMAIWMGLATRSASGRVICIAGPITAFVAMGLEHSIANMFFFSAAFFANPELLPLGDSAKAIAVVTVGNIVGALLLCLFMGFAFRHAPAAQKLSWPGKPPASHKEL